MWSELLQQLPSLGIGGLLFVMWWFERQDRGRCQLGWHDALRSGAQAGEVSNRLVEVVRANTEALTALREELRSHRLSETEWLGRLSQQLERLSAA